VNGIIKIDQKGVALLLTLWVLVLLTVIVSGFVAMVRTEAEGVINFKDETEAYILARSGVNLAIGRLLEERTHPSHGSNLEGEGLERWIFDGRPYDVSLGEGVIEVEITDESGKIGINKTTRTDLIRVLVALGIEGSERDTIADSILDWKDENNFHHLNGAEDDYYQALPEPYESKDGPLDIVEELLWVKGVTPDIFYGAQEDHAKESEGYSPSVGLGGIFTVFTNAVRVNVNTAPFEVLIAIPGIDEETAHRIVDSREEGEIQSMGDFTRVGGKLVPTVSKYVTFASSGIYTIKATGWKGQGGAIYSVKAVVALDRKKGYRILYWKDQDRVRRKVI
jgi:general secretion pathway protein K